MKKLIIALILGIMLIPSLSYSQKGWDTDWINSKTFQTIKDLYGEKTVYNDGVFDCEDFVAAYFLEKEGTIEIPVVVWFEDGKAHVMAGMVETGGHGVIVTEPQCGKFVIAETFVKAVKQFYLKRKFRIQLLDYEVFMNAVLEKIK